MSQELGDGKPLPSDSQVLSLNPLFPLGRVVATPGALRALEAFQTTPWTLLKQHVQGCWGDLDEEDQNENDLSLLHGYRIFSAYTLKRHVGNIVESEKVWIITEWDRSGTTILLPTDY